MKLRFFDFEVLPHWWLCVFGDLQEDHKSVTEDIKNSFVYVTSDMPNARDRLMELMRENGIVVSGYNIKGYDLAIANGIYQGFNPEQIKIINDIIINPSCQWSSKEHIRLAPFAKKKLRNVVYQDLMDDSEGSLKDKESVMGLNILESAVDFNEENLTDNDKKELIYYCKQDVYAAMQFYLKVVHPYTLVKLAMGMKFNIPEATCRASTNARLVSIALGAVRTTFADEEKIEIELPERIKEYCYKYLPNEVLERIRKTGDSFEVKLFDNIVSYGNGGVHSVYKSNIYIESDDEWMLANVDATSYYPSIMIQLKCLSRAVRNPKVFSDIFDERVAIKHKSNKTYEDDMHQRADKLVLNTTFGASGNKWLDLYDPHHCTKVCRVGQIFLSALACRLYSSVPGLKIIQTNTDGILAYFRRKDIDLVKACMKEWTDVSGINMDMDLVDKIWQRDVNNYLLVEDGEVKRRGGWLCDTWERPGYVTIGSLNGFVSSKAVINYLLYDKDIVKSIVSNTNLMDFCISCKKGPSYSYVVQKFNDGTEKRLFKCNRVIASKDENSGMIYKIKKYKDKLSYTKMASIPEHCMLVNEDISSYNFNEIKKNIDYSYYLERAADLLDIPWVQICGTEEYKTNRFDYFGV